MYVGSTIETGPNIYTDLSISISQFNMKIRQRTRINKG